MKATSRRNDGTTDHSDWRPQPSIDLCAHARPRIGEDRDSRIVWNVWCDAAVAGVVWLVLLGLALFALSAVAQHRPAASHSRGIGGEIVR